MPSIPSFTPSSDNLPHGLDRADGLGGRLGTVTPSGAIDIDSSIGKVAPVEELPSSPQMERAEQCTVRKTFTGDYNEMLNRWIVYPRGTLVVDSGGNFFRVLSTTLTSRTGSIGQLEIVCEALSFDNPPDEFTCNTVNLGLDIIKNPRYFYNLMPTDLLPKPWPIYISADTPAQSAMKTTIMRSLQAYRENPLVPPSQIINGTSGFYHDIITALFTSGKGITMVPNENFNPAYIATPCESTPVTTAPAAATANGDYNPPVYCTYFELGVTEDPNDKVKIALAAATELLGKLWRGEDSPPVYGLEITWSEYYWRPPYLNLGGYIEDPQSATPALPDYFTCPASLPNGSTIFDNLSYLNPQYYSQNGKYGGGTQISWLRCADTLEFQRTFFKVTRKWLGAPFGCWDPDLFNQKNRPIYASDYNPLILF